LTKASYCNTVAVTMKKLQPQGSDFVSRLRDAERVILAGIRESRKLRALVEEMVEALRVNGIDPEQYILELKHLGEPFTYPELSLFQQAELSANAIPDDDSDS